MDVQVYLKNVTTLKYDSSLCNGCGLCIEVCPHDVFKMTAKRAEVVHVDKCMECGACQLNCVPGALTVNQGVGCASAVLHGFLKGTAPSCGCEKTETCC